jgi:hypothetical protein
MYIRVNDTHPSHYCLRIVMSERLCSSVANLRSVVFTGVGGMATQGDRR